MSTVTSETQALLFEARLACEERRRLGGWLGGVPPRVAGSRR